MFRRPLFVPDWRQCWRWHSVRAAGVLAALALIQSDVLPFVQPLVPPKYWPYVVCLFAVAIAFFRLLQQQELQELQAKKEQQQAQEPRP